MTLNIWRLSDSKPGHDSQSIGLCNAIERLHACRRFDISVESSLRDLLFKAFPAGTDLPNPDFIIGAGHGTHLPLLAARHSRGGKAIVLMKPSLPISFFDTCIIPKHDLVTDRKNIINTDGALNPVVFNDDKVHNEGLILLGGLSKHYHWTNNAVIDQIETLITNNTGIKWALASSPRTPKSFFSSLEERSISNIEILPYPNTRSARILEQINKASTIWVTKDSVSMVYEALSSGASVGLIELPNNNNSRLEKGINILIKDKKLTTFSNWEKDRTLTSGLIRFNEADRCAKMLLDKWPA